MKYYVSEENKVKMIEISTAIDDLHDDYFEKVARIGENATKMKKGYLNEFFALTNNFRNSVKKELLKSESILQKDVKLHSCFKNKDFKSMIMKEYPAATKAFNDQEGYLRKKVS